MEEMILLGDHSILDSIKKLLGIDSDYTIFDEDIIIHINSAFSTLMEIGVGPKEGFIISDNTKTWNDYINGDNLIEFVKTYIYLKVKLVFDPPQTSPLIDAIERQITELTWRLSAAVDTHDSF